MPHVRSKTGQLAKTAQKRGFTLTELMVTVTIVGVLAAFTVPSYYRAITQSTVDIAGANLRAIWAAERVYYLENQSYTDDLTLLQDLGILDNTLLTSKPSGTIPTGKYWESFYWYSVTVGSTSGDEPYTTFKASANASPYTNYSSTLSIDQDGLLQGGIQASGSSKTTTPIDLW